MEQGGGKLKEVKWGERQGSCEREKAFQAKEK